MLHARLRAIAKLACPTALLIAVCGLAATTHAATTHALPKISGKVTTCHKKLFKVGGTLPVTTAFAVQKGKHPAKSLLTCTHADAVAVAGKKYYSKYPFGVGKKVKVGGVTYTMGQWTMGSLGGKPLSGPLYGWAGGGIVVFLENPSS